LRYFSLPFDWCYSKHISSIIDIINNNFSNFLDISFYDIIKLYHDNFNYKSPNNIINNISKYKLKHKSYNIILPHELKELNDKEINDFYNRYEKRIKRFYNLNNEHKKIIFIRLGLKNEINKLNLLNDCLSKYFDDYELKFIDSSQLDNSSQDWKRDNVNWLNIIKNF
jgi:hypothetical protein